MTYEEDITQQAGEDRTDDKKENITHDANITQHDREKQKVKMKDIDYLMIYNFWNGENGVAKVI